MYIIDDVPTGVGVEIMEAGDKMQSQLMETPDIFADLIRWDELSFLRQLTARFSLHFVI